MCNNSLQWLWSILKSQTCDHIFHAVARFTILWTLYQREHITVVGRFCYWMRKPEMMTS
jgi:hypothetical protein